MDIDLRDLELLDALGRHRTLTAAARHLHVSQPALSQRLLRLEQRLATPLFERRGRQLHVTRAGTRMLAAARVALAELDAAHRDLRELADHRTAPLRIASQCTTNYTWLAEVVHEHRRRSDVVAVAVADAGDDPIAALLADHLDLALVNKLDINSQQVRLDPVFDDEMVAVVAARHPWARRRWISADDFAAVRLVMYDTYDPQREPPIPLPIPHGAVPAELTTPAVGNDMLIEMIAGGEVVSVLSRWVAGPYLARDDLTAVPIGKHGFARTWYAATRHHPRHEHLDAFVATLITHFRHTTAGRSLAA